MGIIVLCENCYNNSKWKSETIMMISVKLYMILTNIWNRKIALFYIGTAGFFSNNIFRKVFWKI